MHQLEAEAIHVIREVAAELEKPVLLFSGGKDSIAHEPAGRSPFVPDPYEQVRATGAFIVVDPATNDTVGAGMVV